MIYNYYFLCNFDYNNVLKLQTCQYDILFVMIGLGPSWKFGADLIFLPFATPPLTNKQLMDMFFKLTG